MRNNLPAEIGFIDLLFDVGMRLFMLPVSLFFLIPLGFLAGWAVQQAPGLESLAVWDSRLAMNVGWLRWVAVPIGRANPASGWGAVLQVVGIGACSRWQLGFCAVYGALATRAAPAADGPLSLPGIVAHEPLRWNS